tara:strand:- start:20310 stop:20633 length:324 start_codon:yes stop_codon:yes gene_type:complete
MPNNYKNALLDLTTTNATVLYTCPGATTAIFKSLLVCNDSSHNDTITITITDADSNVFSVYSEKAISGPSTEELVTNAFVVEENQIVKVTAATANRLHVVASLLEIN